MNTVLTGVSIRATRSSVSWKIAGALLILQAIAGCGGSTTGPQGPVPQGDPTGITIGAGGSAIAPGTTRQLTALATYGNGATADVTGTVTWATSNSAVLTISDLPGSKGMATRLTDASVDVTASLDPVSASWNVTVWSTVIATGLRFDGDVAGTGTGYAIGHLAQDASAVYWAAFDNTAGNSGGTIGRVLKSGGTATTLASNLGGINALASDGTYVYWTEFELATGNGAIKRAPVGGGTVEVLASGTPPGSAYDVFFPGGVALDADNVYWGESVGGGAIRQVPKAGGSVTDYGRGQGFGPTAMLVSGGFFYGVDNATGKAARLPLGGGSVEVLASGLINPNDVAIDAQGLYTAELVGMTGRIVRVPLTGGGATTVSGDLDNPRSVAVQNGSVYFPGVDRSADQPLAGVWKAASDGSSHEFAVDASGTTGGFDPLSLVVDANSIFFVDAAWSTPGGARVLRAPRE